MDKRKNKLTVFNQQLTASEQQLRAANQQLRAANQQLTASDQQLRAANQQLAANEQQLRKTNLDMGERIKELGCLYGLAELIERDITLEQMFQGLVDILPAGWHYPEFTCGRVIFDDVEYVTDNFKETQWVQSADIEILGQKRGAIEVYYIQKMPQLDEGPFLKEERDLIDALAEHLSNFVELIEAWQQLRAVNQQLTASEEKYKGLFEFMSSGVAVYEAVDDGKDFIFRDFNRAGEKIEKLKRDELIGKNLLEVFPGVKEFGLFEVIQRVWKTGKSEHYPVAIYQDERISGWRENDVYKLSSGEVVAVYDDITKRKKAEDELRATNQQLTASDQQLRAANQQLQASQKEMEALSKFPSENANPVLRITKDGKILYCNEAGEVLLANWKTKVGATVSDKWTSLIAEAFEPQRDKDKEEEEEVDDRIFSFVIAPVKESGYANLYARDITERKQAEDERERLYKAVSAKNQELQSIVFIASHDLRSPLVNVKGFAGELEKSCDKLAKVLDHKSITKPLKGKIEPLLREDISESLHFIKAGADKMDSLISGLLRLSRIGTAELDIDRLDMSEMVKSILKTVRFNIQQRDAKIDVGNMPSCLGDSSLVNQVFSNLIDNALKYVDPKRGAQIQISGKSEDGNVIYCVQDNGIGVSDEHREKVFEIFHRLHPKETDGEGLGLTIIRRILDRQDGKIWVESEHGKGSRFYVSLPTV